MDVRELVTTHYGAGDLSGAILDALTSAGVDTEDLEPGDLFAVDQLHAGGVAATKYALEHLASVRAYACSTSAAASAAPPGWRRRTALRSPASTSAPTSSIRRPA